LRRLQTGFVRSYALSMLAGGVLVLGALLAVRLG
jgi:NADH-quinone oxidoreductase subunit L